MKIRVEYNFSCGHTMSMNKEYDFTRDVDAARYESFINFNRIGNNAWCNECDAQRFLEQLHIIMVRE